MSSGGTLSPTSDASPPSDGRVWAGHFRNVSVACVTGSHLNHRLFGEVTTQTQN